MDKVISGFLRADGKKIVSDNNDNVLLRGWGLGNWLLCEGYMWLALGNENFDRPRRIERIVKELIGTKESEKFWQSFRDNYITEKDIAHMKQLGYNSVRIPISAALFIAEEPELIWKEEGFKRLDDCIGWCKKHDMYAFIDLHGASGGQTGANIDDSIDDIPRLFMDAEYFDKTIALWGRLAQIYKDEVAVGGYDLLNEPIRPQSGTLKSYDHLLPMLSEFYVKCIAEIRKYDKAHLISLEGHHWATSLDVFNQKYDDNYVIHFHRYANHPDKASFDEFLEASEKWNVPLWLGETGENKHEWFSAYYKICENYNIGYNLWPYKKMGRDNCPINIKAPEDWSSLLDYTVGAKKPTKVQALNFFNEYLENMKFDNCVKNEAITNYTFRQAPFSLRATDFEEGENANYFSGNPNNAEAFVGYKKGTGMLLREDRPAGEKEFAFDCQWDRFSLVLALGEYASYSFNRATEVSITGEHLSGITLQVGEKRLTPELNKEGTEALFKFGGEIKETLIKISGTNQNTPATLTQIKFA